MSIIYFIHTQNIISPMYKTYIIYRTIGDRTR